MKKTKKSARTKASKKTSPRSRPEQKKPTPKAKLQPLGDRVLVRPISLDEEIKRPSGIIIPDTVDKERPQEGTVIAVGKGLYDDGVLVPLEVKVGDRVMFAKYGYEEVKVDGVEYFIITAEKILAILN